MPAAFEAKQKRRLRTVTQNKGKKRKYISKNKVLTRNSLGSSHELARHLSFTRSRSHGKLLLAVRSLLLQTLLSFGCLGQLQLKALFRTSGGFGFLLRLAKALLQSVDLTERVVMLLCIYNKQASKNRTRISKRSTTRQTNTLKLPQFRLQRQAFLHQPLGLLDKRLQQQAIVVRAGLGGYAQHKGVKTTPVHEDTRGLPS